MKQSFSRTGVISYERIERIKILEKAADQGNIDMDPQGPNFIPTEDLDRGCIRVDLEWIVPTPDDLSKFVDDKGEATILRTFTIERAEEFLDTLTVQLRAAKKLNKRNK